MKKPQLISKTLSVSELTQTEIEDMFRVFYQYYEKISQDVFKSDLSKKDDVILLLDKKTKKIKGFSTLVSISFLLDNKMIRGVFSGDTIVEKDYWGGNALQMAFTSYMLKKKLRNPFTPLYWFLISKGYKTYLLLTNNFSKHYPRFDEPTPDSYKKIMDKFALELYPDNYNPHNGLIEFPELHDHLKDGVAPITEEMKKNSPQIKYFSEINKNWQKGSELVCLANFNLTMPLGFCLKLIKKKILKLKSVYKFQIHTEKRVNFENH